MWVLGSRKEVVVWIVGSEKVDRGSEDLYRRGDSDMESQVCSKVQLRL